MSLPQLRAFLDANILIRGVTLPRFPYEILRHAAHGDFIPVVSPLVLTGARLYVRELSRSVKLTWSWRSGCFDASLSPIHPWKKSPPIPI